MEVPPYVERKERKLRHNNKLIELQPNTEAYKNAFYCRTVEVALRGTFFIFYFIFLIVIIIILFTNIVYCISYIDKFFNIYFFMYFIIVLYHGKERLVAYSRGVGV